MLRARVLKAARARAKAAAKAAKAAAEAAANSGSPDVIVTNTNNNNDANAGTNPEVDTLTCAHQRAMVGVATLIQVHTETCISLVILLSVTLLTSPCFYPGYRVHSVAHRPPSIRSEKHLSPEHKDHPRVR